MTSDWKAAAIKAAEEQAKSDLAWDQQRKDESLRERIDQLTEHIRPLVGPSAVITYDDHGWGATVDDVHFYLNDDGVYTLGVDWVCPKCRLARFSYSDVESGSRLGVALQELAATIAEHKICPPISAPTVERKPLPQPTADDRLLATLRDWVQAELDECLERAT